MSATYQEREKARIEANIAAVKEHIPEMVDIIKDFHARGMIPGWRSVAWAGPLEQRPRGSKEVHGPFLTGREFTETGRKEKR